MLKDHKAVTPVRLEPVALRSRVKHSTTEPLRSQAGWKIAHSGQYLATTSLLLMTKILCAAGRRVPLGD